LGRLSWIFAAALFAAVVGGGCSEPAMATVATVGGVEVRALRSDQGTCLALVDIERAGMSSCLHSRDADVMQVATATGDATGDVALIAGSLPRGVTSVMLRQGTSEVVPRLVSTDLGDFFVATGVSAGDYDLVAANKEGGGYTATISLDSTGTTPVPIEPTD
jgi:hypothetical protein